MNCFIFESAGRHLRIDNFEIDRWNIFGSDTQSYKASNCYPGSSQSLNNIGRRRNGARGEEDEMGARGGEDKWPKIDTHQSERPRKCAVPSLMMVPIKIACHPIPFLKGGGGFGNEDIWRVSLCARRTKMVGKGGAVTEVALFLV